MKAKILIAAFLLSVQTGFGQNDQEFAVNKIEQAIYLTDSGNTEGAVNILKEVQKPGPINILISYEIALAYCMEEDYSTAVEILNSLKKRKDANFQAFQLLGNCHNLGGNREDTIKTYREGLGKFPNAEGDKDGFDEWHENNNDKWEAFVEWFAKNRIALNADNKFYRLQYWALNEILLSMKELTDYEKHIIIDKGTEPPFTGEYCDLKGSGIYLCRQCGTPLYRSVDKFSSGCGWPSFDDEIEGTVRRTPDPDGRRTEITCANCGGHLGHVFEGEGFTPKNTRHCVNSVSLKFVPDENDGADKPTGSAPHQPETAYFAGGCFWGVEHLMQKQEGVISVESGYMGGHVENPAYEQVCTRGTGHAEVVKVTYDPDRISYLTLAKLFFEIHDPTQADGQGPDIGDQYRSEVFYTSLQQKATAERLIKILRQRGYDVVTNVTPASTFWKAEDYHQDYYERKGTQPYCHKYTKRFD